MSTSDASVNEPGTQEPPARQVQHVSRGGSTGDQWKDVQLAVKSISLWDDLNNIGNIPCARNSLLGGIASGIGMGAIRGISASPLVACNWAVGTFLFISMGSWTVCQRQRKEEVQRMQQIVEEMPKRRLKRREAEADKAGQPTSPSLENAPIAPVPAPEAEKSKSWWSR